MDFHFVLASCAVKKVEIRLDTGKTRWTTRSTGEISRAKR